MVAGLSIATLLYTAFVFHIYWGTVRFANFVSTPLLWLLAPAISLLMVYAMAALRDINANLLPSACSLSLWPGLFAPTVFFLSLQCVWIIASRSYVVDQAKSN